jgi:hypothetical protein
MIGEAPTESNCERYDVEWVGTVSDGFQRLATNQTSAVLLDPQLTGRPGIDGLGALLRIAPAMPILVVGAEENEAIARQVIRAGGRDCVLAKRLDSRCLPRSLNHAISWTLSEEALFAEIERSGRTVESIGAGLPGTDIASPVTLLNRCAEAMTGWSGSPPGDRPRVEVLQLVDGVADLLGRAIPGNGTQGRVSYCILIGRERTS